MSLFWPCILGFTLENISQNDTNGHCQLAASPVMCGMYAERKYGMRLAGVKVAACRE